LNVQRAINRDTLAAHTGVSARGIDLGFTLKPKKLPCLSDPKYDQIKTQFETDSAEELVQFLHEMLSRRLEGVVVKRPDAPCHVGARLFDWIKIKREHSGQSLDTYDLVVVGYFSGPGM
jgi:ATP-dependent DNA ligase